MIHIEPCPFCGCTLEKSETFSTRSTTYFVHPHYVDEDEQCVASSIRVPVSDRKDDNHRLASWNRRAPTPQPRVMGAEPALAPDYLKDQARDIIADLAGGVPPDSASMDYHENIHGKRAEVSDE